MILLAVAPFMAIAIAERFLGGRFALASGALTSAVLLTSDWIRGKRSLEVLEIGTFVLFAGLTVYACLSGATWGVRRAPKGRWRVFPDRAVVDPFAAALHASIRPPASSRRRLEEGNPTRRPKAVP